MNLREAAQQALEALSEYEKSYPAVADAFKPLRAALAEDSMQRLTDVQQEMDCYGDGNVYRGQRSRDSETKTITFSKVETVEPVAWMHEWDGTALLNTVPPDYYGDHWKHTPLYPAPPKRKPLTDEEIRKVVGMTIDGVTVSESVTFRAFARAFERAHGIGGE